MLSQCLALKKDEAFLSKQSVTFYKPENNFYRGANLKSYFCDMYLFFPLLTFLLKTQKVSL